ncbi:MAG TPA: DCC1-like thiol-disulfide oxidoreductase family protein, partial [Tepidisphaeraceae bacterium]|nr:DCC1-like thiol-disulfide oxidoreductase family protein [Tepidisphaeraceae bacterium]
MPRRRDPAIILFDGVCNFCEASVQFVIDRDPGGRFVFAPLQSPTGRRLLAGHGLGGGAIDSVVLV